MTASPQAVLGMGAERTTLSQDGVATVVAPGWAQLQRACLNRWPPHPADMENAIALIEDELMRLPRDLRHLHVSSDEPMLREIAHAAGLQENDKRLDRDVVERVFERLAAVALGRPNAQERLPETPRFAAILLILREMMHHLDISSIRLR
ncbi:MAG TPA: hypothetical protein VL425_05530 [Rudaea sp.]|nr:hypothetical protein [Rudaea sp.]